MGDEAPPGVSVGVPDEASTDRLTDTQLALASLAGSGLDSSRFTVWLGGAPLPDGLDRTATIVLKVSPGELSGLVEDLDAERRVAWVKRPDRVEWFVGAVGDLEEGLAEARPGAQGGSADEAGWLVVAGAAPAEADDAQLEAAIDAELSAGTSPSRAAKVVAARLGVPKRRVYELAFTRRDRGRRPPPS